ncbi:AI-2E family transporter [Alteribacter lacisalsi]|uniref:AI-2E family transporter n=1 Tax=Alteribacter lacisalsi TaxID=2045244 RepID=A0A2W0HMH8_9BACI|nr:AI-2E family transporter [Alteribacter lacisalsi]PYZ98785.1 AI-2E family transporter [Alteribacter lacisalsi]
MREGLVRRLLQLGIILLVLMIAAIVYIMFEATSGLWLKAARILLPFIVAVFLTYLLHPAVEWLDYKGIRRPYSILLIFGVFTGAFLLAVVKATPYLIAEGKDLLEELPVLANTYREWVSDFHTRTAWLPDNFQAKAEAWLERGEALTADLILGLVNLLRTIWDLMFLIIVIPFIVFYLLKDIRLIYKVIWYFTPEKWRAEGKQLITDVDESLGNYIRGQLLVCIGVGLVSFAGFWLIGLPYASLIAAFVALTNIIPYFGPIIGAVPAVAVALTEDVNLVFLVIGVIFVVQMIEGNVLAPLIVGRSLHMHPVLIIFALVVGGELAGILGLIVAVPLLAVAKVFIIHIRKLIRDKRPPVDHDPY